MDLNILLISAFALFLQMLLIRWVGSEIRVFAYLQNGLLIASFLGLGLGMCSRKRARLWTALGSLLLISFAVRDPFHLQVGEAITQGLIAFEDSDVWVQTLRDLGILTQAPWLKLPAISFSITASFILLGATALVFFPMGRQLGLWIEEHPRPIRAYTFNLFGSVLGITIFQILTVLYTPPWVWLIGASAGFLWLGRFGEESPWVRRAGWVMLCLLPVLGTPKEALETVWSPYQKLMLQPLKVKSHQSGRMLQCGEILSANNIQILGLLNLDPQNMAQDPDAYPADAVHTSHYILPYDLIGRRDRVLILGSGAGNDTASALFQGARFVRAVEIDPQIVRWGKERHPNHPYTSANVSAEVEDARAWLHRDSEKYDLIWIGLLDAQTGSSAYTSVRLDHYVYTRESMQEIRDHLAPGGIAVVYFGIAGRLWIADRLANTLRETYGTYPLAMRVVSESPCLGSGGFMLMAGNPEDVAKAKARAMAKPLSARMVLPVESWPGTMEPASDDWPYFYLKGRGVPKYHVVVGLACLLLAFVLGWRLRLGMDFSRLTMILLGMGFMLLEISGVSRAALLYGTTWAVNSYVVASILGMALLANFVASRFRYFPFGWPLIGLLASLGLLTWLPPAWFLGFSLPMRIVAGGLFLALPVFFSGLVFVRQWSQLKQKDVALGYNMIGSLVGGVLSMLSMWLGFKALLMITIAIYIAAFVSGRRGAGSSS